jgi:hypothetical protein
VHCALDDASARFLQTAAARLGCWHEAFTAHRASTARSPISMALRPSRPLTSPKQFSTGAF